MAARAHRLRRKGGSRSEHGLDQIKEAAEAAEQGAARLRAPWRRSCTPATSAPNMSSTCCATGVASIRDRLLCAWANDELDKISLPEPDLVCQRPALPRSDDARRWPAAKRHDRRILDMNDGDDLVDLLGQSSSGCDCPAWRSSSPRCSRSLPRTTSPRSTSSIDL